MIHIQMFAYLSSRHANQRTFHTGTKIVQENQKQQNNNNKIIYFCENDNQCNLRVLQPVSKLCAHFQAVLCVEMS